VPYVAAVVDLAEGPRMMTEIVGCGPAELRAGDGGGGGVPRSLALAGRWAFEGLGVHRLELGHAVGHEVSCRVAERCGFLYEGTLRGAMFEAGRQDAFRDVHLHARLATDAEAVVS
jgi:RimJ/RimL family protein N-acetyltransferase